jgi:uncharacterized membrane protein YdjX (TVP38/TMEM64 family)
MKRSGWLRLGILALLVTLIVVVFAFLPLEQYRAQLVGHRDDLGMWGPAAITAIFVLACLLMIPVTPISLAAGMIFKFWTGLITVAIGSIVGPALTYFVGKYLGRGWVASAMARNRTLRAIDRAVADQGFKIIFLARLSPFVPYGAMNYMFSLSRVRFFVYITATFLGVLPSTVAYAYLGSLANNLDELIAAQSEGGVIQALLFWGGLAATLIVSVIITLVAKNALAKALGEMPEEVPLTLPQVVQAVQEAVSSIPTAEQGQLSDAKVVV